MSQNPIATQAFGRTGAGASKPVAVDANGNVLVAPATGATQPVKMSGLKYVTCAASTTQPLGTGAAGDTLNSLLVVPGTTSPGAVQIKDGSGAAITVFTGGATSVGDLRPFSVSLNAISAAGGWSVITSTNVTAVAVGQFTP